MTASPPEVVARMVLDFWAAVALLLRNAGSNPRKTLLCKGVGVYALMGIAADLVNEAGNATIDKLYFRTKLADFVREVGSIRRMFLLPIRDHSNFPLPPAGSKNPPCGRCSCFPAEAAHRS